MRTHPRAARAAVALLTRLPVGGFPYTARELRWSAAYLPLVGTAIGAALGGVWMMTFSRGGGLLAAAMVVAASLLLTGALHEDGLADTADALGGGTTREKIFAILKDSRIGTFGTVALVSTLLLRVAALVHLGSAAPASLVLSQAASRAAPTVLLASLPYVTDSAASKSGAVATAGMAQASVALLSSLAIAGGVLGAHRLSSAEIGFALGAAAMTTALAGLRFRARAGGVTGDFLGAAQQLADCAILVTLALAGGARHE